MWAVILGAAVWGDLPGRWILAGAVLVIGGGLYVWRRELALARGRARPR